MSMRWSFSARDHGVFVGRRKEPVRNLDAWTAADMLLTWEREGREGRLATLQTFNTDTALRCVHHTLRRFWGERGNVATVDLVNLNP